MKYFNWVLKAPAILLLFASIIGAFYAASNGISGVSYISAIVILLIFVLYIIGEVVQSRSGGNRYGHF